MNKIIISLLLVSTFCITTCNYCPQRVEEKMWTIMLYVDEDFSPSFGRFNHIKNHLCSNDQINIVVIEDQNITPANYWYIDEGYESILLEELGEVNMGDSETLSKFINYAKENYPAENYLLALSNHGGGWIGACWDQSHNDDWLSPSDIEKALEANGKVDILMMIACSMASVETAYQLSQLNTTYIGSANPTGYEYFGRVWDKIISFLMNSDNLTKKEIGSFIVDEIWNKAVEMSAYEENLTFSAINCQKLDELVGLLDEISTYYLNNFDDYQVIFNRIINNINYHRNDAVDLRNLISKLLSNEHDHEIKDKLSEILNKLDEVIINERHGENVKFSNGLSIYFPNPFDSYLNEMYYSNNFNLMFANDTHWDELIHKYFTENQQLTIYKIPNMPID